MNRTILSDLCNACLSDTWRLFSYVMGDYKINLAELSSEEMIAFCLEKGKKAFSGKQLFRWIFKHGTDDFAAMSNLAKDFRTLLETVARIERLDRIKELKSSDGTAKTLWKTSDGEFVESVLIPDERRLTLCLSAQAGCPIGCRFCATGLGGFKRNLSAGEIYNQFIQTRRSFPPGVNITNVVFMGMGEPLLNYAAVAKAIGFLTSQDGGGLAYRRITISTIGLVNGITNLLRNNARLGLAISLHSAIEKKRKLLIPKAGYYTLSELKQAALDYVKWSRRRITFEYMLIDGFNDTREDAEALLDFVKDIPCKINLIACNPVDGSPFGPPTEAKVFAFEKYVSTHVGVVTRRKSMGKDIGAACGQLAGNPKTAGGSEV